MKIREIDADECLSRLDTLSALLIDAVESGASVGFLAPLHRSAAGEFWRDVAAALAAKQRHLLVAESGGRIGGSIQLGLAAQSNAAHRAEVMKLLVHRDARGRGLATALLAAAEVLARRLGRCLLVLDTRQGDDAERLYRRIGYRTAGTIPEYALSSDGRFHTTVFMYKQLDRASTEGSGA
jgi:GNAT superfamily N-acetyltransferase